MRKTLLAMAAGAVLLSAPLGAEERLARTDDHLLSPQVAQERLLEAAGERARDLATVEALVTSPEGTAALAAVGLDQGRVRGALATLSDAELQDLAARAAALQSDPAAGAFTTRQVVWIALIALAVIILVAIVA